MTSRALALLTLLAACAPKDPGATATESAGDTTDATASTSDATASTSGAVTSSTSGATTSSTDAASSSSSSSSASATTDAPPACSWYLPENQGLVFCPAPVAENAAITGTTPYGPVDMRYAHFGLFLCANCPDPQFFSLRLFADPPDLGQPVGDYLAFENLSGLTLAQNGAPGSIGGQMVDMPPLDIALSNAVIPTVEQTSPPLDEGAPPIVSGTLTLKGDGWDVSGTFTAGLCTELDWIIPCE